MNALRTYLAACVERRGLWELVLVSAYLAFVIPFGEHYPLSPLEMFSVDHPVVGRIGAVEAGAKEGDRLEPIAHFADWSCPMGYTLDESHFRACFPEGFSSLADFESRALRARKSQSQPPDGNTNGSPDRIQVRLVRRLYSLERDNGPFVTRDCVMQTCTARRVSP